MKYANFTEVKLTWNEVIMQYLKILNFINEIFKIHETLWTDLSNQSVVLTFHPAKGKKQLVLIYNIFN